MGGLPVRVAPAGDVAGDVEYVLGGKGQARQRTAGRRRQEGIAVLAEGVVGIVDNGTGSCHIAAFTPGN